MKTETDIRAEQKLARSSNFVQSGAGTVSVPRQKSVFMYATVQAICGRSNTHFWTCRENQPFSFSFLFLFLFFESTVRENVYHEVVP